MQGRLLEVLNINFKTFYFDVRYVGSHCIVELLEEGYNVAILDNFSNSCIGM